MSLIVLAIPVFFLLIGIEVLIDRMSRLSYYRFNDAVTNLSLGIGSQLTGVFLKLFTVTAYIALYEISPLKGVTPNTWWSYILLFIGVDFFYYWFHRLAHEISILWGSHVVHHQSEEYNLTVALRQAWFQGAFSWVFYLPLAVLGFDPKAFFVIASIQTLYQFWIHTRVINKLPAPIEYVFNTPSHHRVHHGVNPKYIDKNHGGTLIIFDRMFGTFQAEEEEVVYGITKQPKSWNPLWVNFEYWVDLFKDVFRVKGFGNRIKMLVKMPGWKPAELGPMDELKNVTPQTFHKYDTDISPGLNYYVLLQFIVVLGGATYFLKAQMNPPFTDNMALKLSFVALVIMSIINIGGVFEKKSWLPLAEVARLIALSALVLYMVQGATHFYLFAGVTVLFCVLSLIWFFTYRNDFKNSLQYT